MSRGLGIELTALLVAVVAIFALGKLMGFLASLQMRLFLALLVLLAIVGLLLWRRYRSLRRKR